jgi:hypothetical protein
MKINRAIIIVIALVACLLTTCQVEVSVEDPHAQMVNVSVEKPTPTEGCPPPTKSVD